VHEHLSPERTDGRPQRRERPPHPLLVAAARQRERLPTSAPSPRAQKPTGDISALQVRQGWSVRRARGVGGRRHCLPRHHLPLWLPLAGAHRLVRVCALHAARCTLRRR
jgi:hypothetical protein